MRGWRERDESLSNGNSSIYPGGFPEERQPLITGICASGADRVAVRATATLAVVMTTQLPNRNQQQRVSVTAQHIGDRLFMVELSGANKLYGVIISISGLLDLFQRPRLIVARGRWRVVVGGQLQTLSGFFRCPWAGEFGKQ